MFQGLLIMDRRCSGALQSGTSRRNVRANRAVYVRTKTQRQSGEVQDEKSATVCIVVFLSSSGSSDDTAGITSAAYIIARNEYPFLAFSGTPYLIESSSGVLKGHSDPSSTVYALAPRGKRLL